MVEAHARRRWRYEEGDWASWQRCTKCAGLVEHNGVCPKGGEHAPDPRVFLLWLGEGIPGVTDDARDSCGKCAGLFNFAGGSVGVCPAGGGHQRNGVVVKLVVLY